jgi:hypothetical protein
MQIAQAIIFTTNKKFDKLVFTLQQTADKKGIYIAKYIIYDASGKPVDVLGLTHNLFTDNKFMVEKEGKTD